MIYGRAGPRSVTRTLEILRELTTSPNGKQLRELTAVLGLPKSSMLILLKTLEANGYIASRDGRYTLGHEAFGLALSIAKLADFPSILVPTLAQVARASGETASLGVRAEQGPNVYYAAVIEGDRALRLHARVGDVTPINAVVVGQVILAFMPDGERERLLDQASFTRETRYSMNREDLGKRLIEIRRDGYAVGIGGLYEDVMGVAAPVFDHTGGIRCAVAVGGPLERLREQQVPVIEAVLDGAHQMSRLLGFDAPRIRRKNS